MATQTYVAGTGGGSSTTITIDVSGETFSSGDQIVVFAGSDSSDSTDSSVSDDGSNSYTNLQSSSSTDPGLNLWVATLDGTETTVTVTTTTSGPNWSGAAVILRGYNSIVGGDVTTTLGGGGGMPNPPAGTAEAGDDVLVIGALEDDVTDPITAPAGYTMLGFGNLGSSGSGCDIMAAIRATVSAGSENPSAFGGGGDDGWAAATLILTPTGGPEPEPSAMKVQHISDDVTNSGGTNTSFTEVASLSYAVELANNNRMTHAGAITGTSNGDDLAGGRVLTAVDTLTYYRESASNTTAANFRTSIWEYTGATGGPNEFVVLGRVAVTLNGSTRTYASTSGFTAPTDRNAVVPFITGIMNDDSGAGADSGTAIAWIDSSDRLNVEKGTISNNVTVYVTLVEFSGSNWTVLHGDSGDFSADTGTFDLYAASDFTGSVTAVTDQADSLIISGFRGDTAATGTNQAIADHWPLVTFTDNDTLDWEFDTNHDSNGTNRVVAHVIENSEWAVTRYTAADSGPLETTFDITSSGLTDLTQSLVVGHAYSSGTGNAYSRGWRNFYFNSLTEVGASASRTGNNLDYAVQIVDMTAMSAGGGTTFDRATAFAGSSTLAVAFKRVKTSAVAIGAAGALATAPNRVKTVATAFGGTSSTTTAANRVKGSSTLAAGSGSLVVAPTRVKQASTAASGVGTLTIAADRVKQTSTVFAATGTLTTTPEAAAVVKLASTVFAGSSSVATLSNRVRAANTAFAGSGALTTASNRVKNTATVTTGTGALTTVPTTVRTSSTAFAGTSSFTTTPAGAPISAATSFAGAGSLTVRATVVRVRTTSVAATSTVTTVPRLVQVRTTSSGAVSALNTVPIRVSPRTTIFGGRSSLRTNPRRVRSSTTQVDGVGRLITRGVGGNDGTGRTVTAALSRNALVVSSAGSNNLSAAPSRSVLTINVTNPNTAAVVSPGPNRAVLTGQTPTRAN